MAPPPPVNSVLLRKATLSFSRMLVFPHQRMSSQCTKDCHPRSQAPTYFMFAILLT